LAVIAPGRRPEAPRAVRIGDYRRIALFGNGGSGKTWLAQRLAASTRIRAYHLDRVVWQPGWVRRPPEDVAAWHRDIFGRDEWIIDGEHGDTTAVRFAAAEVVVLLDRNRIACLVNVLLRRRDHRPDLPDGMTEPRVLSRGFRHFARHIWAYPDEGRRTVLALHERYPDKPFVRVTTRRAARRLLAHAAKP